MFTETIKDLQLKASGAGYIAKMNEQKIEEKKLIENRYEKEKENLSNIQLYSNVLKQIELTTRNEYEEYKKRRIQFLDKTITENIFKIFPNDGFIANTVYETKRGKSNAYVTLIDKNGKIRIPKYSEGGLLKELIGFTASISLLECLGSNVFFFDEAFGMSSETNKAKLGNILTSYVKSGVQLFLVSQSSELYSNLPARCIYMERNSDTNSIVITDVEDINMEV